MYQMNTHNSPLDICVYMLHRHLTLKCPQLNLFYLSDYLHCWLPTPLITLLHGINVSVIHKLGCVLDSIWLSLYNLIAHQILKNLPLKYYPIYFPPIPRTFFYQLIHWPFSISLYLILHFECCHNILIVFLSSV